MGHIRNTRISILSQLSDIVGYKSGLLLSTEEIISLLPEHESLFNGDPDEEIRIESGAAENIARLILYRIGNLPSPHQLPPVLTITQKYADDEEKLALVFSLLALLSTYISNSTSSPIDLDPYMQQVLEQFGSGAPIRIALEIISHIQTDAHASLFSQVRRFDWKDTKALKDLFDSESLGSYYGNFFDQRYIDYLYQNFEDISNINWRQFEGLTAHYFEQAGFNVEIGPGRNDGGIDIRIWPKEINRETPSLIIIQCKREKAKIKKGVVKALYADIDFEGANSGLIVTSNALSQGAREVIKVRNYPIEEANRETIKQWIEKMRTPDTGIFMGE